MNKIFLSIICLLFSIACGDDHDNEIDGLQSDTIELSESLVKFDSDGGSKVLTTKGDIWNLSGAIDVNEQGVPITIDTSKEFEFVGEWYTINRTSLTELKISVQATKDKTKRKISIPLQSKNFGTHIDVFQNY